MSQRISPFIVLVAAAICMQFPLPSAAVDRNGDQQSLLAREHQYTQGILHGDVKSLQDVWAETFVDTSDSGKLRDKKEMLALVGSTTAPSSIDESERRIQFYGDTAIVTVRFTAKGTDHGKSYEYHGRATDVWVRMNGRWFCVAAHSSEIH